MSHVHHALPASPCSRTPAVGGPRLGPPGSWLAPLAFGADRFLPNRVFPGPMEGITRGAFCRVMSDRGYVRCWITPFVRVSGAVPRRARLEERLRPFLDTAHPVIVQLMGHEIPFLTETARRVVDLGAVGIDLNCACPSRTAVRHGAGGARLRSPRWIHRALENLRRACPDHAVSVKLRTGFAGPDEMPGILEAVRAAAPDFVILHFRTVSEEYGCVSDGLDRLKRARDLLPNLLLLGSGDLFSVADAAEMSRVAAVDGVAPARGLLRNPHLLTEIEAACAGGAPPPAWSDRERLVFLLQIARTALVDGERRRGFLLELAAHMFGRSHSLFRTLTGAADLQAATDLLEQETDR
ncbi:MAG: tRNA-dihydrouridine synthase [Kiritimatiellaeota bacterium]|nr:tRNA-dihydrouridine synthase [Kiritimatiellota bacterium]